MAKKEWEQTEQDNKDAVTGIGALALGLLAMGIKGASDSQKKQQQTRKAQRKEYLESQISQKQSRYNQIDSKWFPSAAEKEEKVKLAQEIKQFREELKNL